MLRMWVKFKEENGKRVIDKATFQTFGCETAIAVASLATELIAGKTAEEALNLSGEELSAPLGPLPPLKIHCAQLVEVALRSALAPELPTIGETLPGYEATAWQGLFAPAGTPRPIVDKLAAEAKQILDLPGVIAALHAVGAEPAPLGPDALATFARAERAKWKEVVRVSGARIE